MNNSINDHQMANALKHLSTFLKFVDYDCGLNNSFSKAMLFHNKEMISSLNNKYYLSIQLKKW